MGFRLSMQTVDQVLGVAERRKAASAGLGVRKGFHATSDKHL
jgi:hypothetical protein